LTNGNIDIKIIGGAIEMKKLYHVTTEKKAKQYQQTGRIISPVRGFDTLLASMAWAIKTGRKVIYTFEVGEYNYYKLPDHHNKYGEAYWIDNDIMYEDIKCEYSGAK